MLAAQTGFCSQDAKKQGNIKQRKREQTLKNTCWPNTEAPYAQLYPDCWLTAGWPACMPTLSQASTHTYTHTNTNTQTDSHTHTHTCNTRFTGDKPARVILAYFSARSVLQHRLHTPPLQRREKGGARRGGWRMRGDGGEVRKRVEEDGGSGWKLERVKERKKMTSLGGVGQLKRMR